MAPISLLMIAVWLATAAAPRIASRFGLLHYVWHPALFLFAVCMIVLAPIVLGVAR